MRGFEQSGPESLQAVEKLGSFGILLPDHFPDGTLIFPGGSVHVFPGADNTRVAPYSAGAPPSLFFCSSSDRSDQPDLSFGLSWASTFREWNMAAIMSAVAS